MSLSVFSDQVISVSVNFSSLDLTVTLLFLLPVSGLKTIH